MISWWKNIWRIPVIQIYNTNVVISTAATMVPLHGRNLRSFGGLRQLLLGNAVVMTDNVVRHVVVAGDTVVTAVVVATLSFIVVVETHRDSTFTGTLLPPGVDGCFASLRGSILIRDGMAGFVAVSECLLLELLTCLLWLSPTAPLVLQTGAATTFELLVVVAELETGTVLGDGMRSTFTNAKEWFLRPDLWWWCTVWWWLLRPLPVLPPGASASTAASSVAALGCGVQSCVADLECLIVRLVTSDVAVGCDVGAELCPRFDIDTDDNDRASPFVTERFTSTRQLFVTVGDNRSLWRSSENTTTQPALTYT